MCCSTCQIHFCPICFWCPNQQAIGADAAFQVPGYAIHRHMVAEHDANPGTFVVHAKERLQRQTLLRRAVDALYNNHDSDEVHSAAVAKCVEQQVISADEALDYDFAQQVIPAAAGEEAPVGEPALAQEPAPAEQPAEQYEQLAPDEQPAADEQPAPPHWPHEDRQHAWPLEDSIPGMPPALEHTPDT